MTELKHLNSGELFDINASLEIPVTKRAGMLYTDETFKGGGSIAFELPNTTKNQRLIEPDERGMIKVVLQQGQTAVVGELVVLDNNQNYWSVEVEDIRSSAIRRLKSLRARDVYMDDLDHAYTDANVIAARSSGWVYPFVDYGLATLRFAGFNSSAINAFLAGDIKNDIFNFRPAMFGFDFIQRAFKQIGWEVSGSIFQEGSWFRKLAMPFSQGNMKMTEGQAALGSGAAYLDTAQTATPSPYLVVWDTTTNPAQFSTSTGRYTAPFNCIVNYRVLITGSLGAVDYPQSVGVILSLNSGTRVAQDFQAVEPNSEFQIQLTGTRFLNANDTLEVVLINSPFTLTNFAGAGSRLEVSVIDTLAFGRTVRMAETMPDVTAGDLIKGLIGTPCFVLDTDPQLAAVTITPFWEYYKGQQEIEIDQEEFERMTYAPVGQNNYLNYSGDSSFGNGGFTINDTRLPREAEAFTSIFGASQMTPALYGAWKSIAKLFDGDRPNLYDPNTGWAFNPVPPSLSSPRLLIIQRESVEDLNNLGLQAIQIGSQLPEEINHAYFFNINSLIESDLSLSFADEPDAIGISLAKFAWELYAQDFTEFEEINVNAKLGDAEVASLSFSKLVPYKKSLYRIISVNNYVSGELANLTLRRVGTILAEMLVLPQSGKAAGTQSGASGSVQLSVSPPSVSFMNRLNITFSGVGGDLLLIGGFDPDSVPAGIWNDIVTNDYVVIPESGYYAIFFQVAASGGDGAKLNSLWYMVQDSLGAELFRRELPCHEKAHNIQNEEYLIAGQRVEFYASFSGSATLVTDKKNSFATITQRSQHG